jgi:Reverse transcriptase (RNA-dependent DNA polymerase).
MRKADVQSVYPQGREVDRIICYRIPKGGIPEEGIQEGDVIAARVPIYCTKEAGRGWWLKLNDVVKQYGFVPNAILPTLFACRNKEGRIVLLMYSKVDDSL